MSQGPGDPSMRASPRISVVVPVWNALPHLVAAVDSIVEAASEYGNAEIVVVDNGSTDGSFELLRERYAHVASTFRLTEGTVGAVRNYGVAQTTGAYLSFIDADCCIPSDYFRRAMEVLSRQGVSVTGSKYRLPPAPHWIEKTWSELHHTREEGFVSYLPAGNLICERSAFEAVGGFDSTLESGEDAELCQRLRDAGFRIFESREVDAVHLGNPKSLSAFFRKQLWHAEGMLGTFRHHWKDLPLLATIAHVILMLGGILLLFLLDSTAITFFGGLLVLWLTVPSLAVLYRFFQHRRFSNPTRAVLLYSVYFAARVVALARITVKLVRPSASSSRVPVG